MHKIEISRILKNSIADELGIEPGDFLVSVNEQVIHDVSIISHIVDTNLTWKLRRKTRG